uniref:Transporter n=1 Tax=Dictyoglomus thermophilum TaxID=14 RepID=A0A7C3RKB9_DICTH
MTENIITNIFIIFLGYFIKKIKILPSEAGSTLSRFVIYITLPATILKVFLTSYISHDIFFLPFISFSFGIVVFIIGFIFLRNKKLDNNLRWTLLIGICGYNVGLFSYPFIRSFYGDEGLLYMAMFDIGNSFIVFGLSYALSILSEGNWSLSEVKNVIKKVLLFFPLDVYFVSLILNLLKVNFPSIFISILNYLSLSNFTLALFTIGYFLDFKLDKKEIEALFYGLVIRFIPGILFAIFLRRFLEDSLFIRIISLGVLLPAPLVVVIYSNEMGLNSRFASLYVSLTILIGTFFLIIFK